MSRLHLLPPPPKGEATLGEVLLRLQFSCYESLGGEEGKQLSEVQFPLLLFIGSSQAQCVFSALITLTSTWISGLSHEGDGTSLFVLRYWWRKRQMRTPEILFFFYHSTAMPGHLLP